MTIAAGHLFAGIDGFGLGLGAVGIDTAWTCELAEFPHGILKLRADHAEHHRDVVTFKHPSHVDVLTGGFPCQDLSLAGLGAGIGGSRSGLWTEYARIIGEASPTVVLIENVPALLSRGFELVVENLLELGYVVEWDCLPAAAFGAPHLRDRVFVVAHRGTAPVVFGAAAGLFAHPWRELLPTRPNGWRKWPRAGFVNADGFIDLEPLAPLAALKRGQPFPTPVARDWKGSAARGLWPTPRTGSSLSGGGETGTYRRTPSAAAGTHGKHLQAEAVESDLEAGRITEADVDAMRATGGALNPAWVEWLMGFPIGWTDPAVSNDEVVAHGWHDGEPDGIPRTTRDDPAKLRKPRLIALGNALVPPAAAWLGARILPILEATR